MARQEFQLCPHMWCRCSGYNWRLSGSGRLHVLSRVTFEFDLALRIEEQRTGIDARHSEFIELAVTGKNPPGKLPGGQRDDYAGDSESAADDACRNPQLVGDDLHKFRIDSRQSRGLRAESVSNVVVSVVVARHRSPFALHDTARVRRQHLTVTSCPEMQQGLLLAQTLAPSAGAMSADGWNRRVRLTIRSEASQARFPLRFSSPLPRSRSRVIRQDRLSHRALPKEDDADRKRQGHPRRIPS